MRVKPFLRVFGLIAFIGLIEMKTVHSANPCGGAPCTTTSFSECEKKCCETVQGCWKDCANKYPNDPTMENSCEGPCNGVCGDCLMKCPVHSLGNKKREA